MNLQLMLQYYRYRRDMTQADLAHASKILQPNISRMEKWGSDNISTATLRKLSKALGVSPADLLDEKLFLNQDKKASFSRMELEQIAQAVWNKKIHLKPRLQRVVSIYRAVLPDFSKRYIPRQKSYMAWLDLKTLLSHQEIRNLQTRIAKAKQRDNAARTN